MALFDALDVSVYVPYIHICTHTVQYTVPFAVQLLGQRFPAMHLSIMNNVVTCQYYQAHF